MPSDTQIVAQWAFQTASRPGLTGSLEAFVAMNRCIKAEIVIANESRGLYEESGNDIGSGTCNVYLYTDRVDETVTRIASLVRAKRVPSGLRIGVAVYKNKERTDWTYRAAYPSTLTRFDLFGG